MIRIVAIAALAVAVALVGIEATAAQQTSDADAAAAFLGMGFLVFFFVFLCGLWVVPAIVGAWLANSKGRHLLLGAAFGLFLSWLGVIITLLLSPSVEHEAMREAEKAAHLRRIQGSAYPPHYPPPHQQQPPPPTQPPEQ